MKTKINVILIALFTAVFAGIMCGAANTPTLAKNYYGGNNQTSAYGVMANIYTPSSHPYTPYNQSAWVSTQGFQNAAGNYSWLQTGWLWSVGNNTASAYPYTEFENEGFADQEVYGTQSWGASKNYTVQYYSDVNAWYAAIDGFDKIGVYGSNISAPPITVYAHSEVTLDSTTQVASSFWNVKWKDSSGGWNYFNQNCFWQVKRYPPSAI